MLTTIAAKSRAVTVFVVSAAVVAGLAVALPTVSNAITPTQTFAPAQLINESALEAPAQVNGSYYPGGMFAATDAERTAVNAVEAQAVANTLADHGLPAGDGPSILSWARADADANLWALILQAVNDVHDGKATSTEQSVNQWLVDSLKRQSILSTQDTGLEYTKWAGLGTATYNNLIKNNASLTQLTSFLSTTPNPYTGTGSATNPAGSTDGGYCVYQSPAPDQADYTGNIFGDDAPQTCYTPCTGLQDCGPPVPEASQFATWGSADYENASLASFGSSNGVMATAESASLLATVTTVGSGFAGVGTGALFNGSDLAFSFLKAVQPFATRAFSAGAASLFKVTPQASVSSATSTGETATEGVEDGLEAADEVGLDAGSTGIGIVLTAIIFVITTAIQEGLKIVGAANVPGQIAGMIDSARTATPDPYAAEQGSPGTMFALFMNATIPQPSHNSCDNDFIVSSQAALGTPCLNPTAIPAPTSYDPGFTITPAGGSTTTSPTLTLMDASSGWTPSYRLHGNWVVSTATVSGTTASVQGLTMHYSDWTGAAHTAWVYADHTPTSFVTVADDALGPNFDPKTCQQQGTCSVTSSIQVVSPGGTDETVGLTPGAAAPTLPAGPCASGPSCTATTTTVTGATSLDVGDTATFTAAVNADAGVSGTADFTAGTGATGCTGVALQAPGGQGGIVTGKVATCSITFSKVGTYFVFATYDGATTYDPSQGELTVNVGGGGGTVASTSTTVTAASNALVVGQPDVFTATVDTGASGIAPGGTVAFTSSSGGAVTLCTAAVLSNTAPYTATCPYAFFAWDLTNPVTVTATYSGDPATLSSSGHTPITLTPATTTTTVTASTDHPSFGEDVTYTATVAINAPGGGIPQGGVTFSGGASCDSLEVTRTPPFIATCTASYSTGGTHEVDAAYRGDSLSGSSSGSVTVFAGPAPTTTTGTPTDGTGHIGVPDTDTAVVTSPIDTPTGFVTFSVCGPLEFTNVGCPSGGTAVGSGVDLDASGSATSATFTPSHAGVYCFRADFSDDGFYYTDSSDGSSTNCIQVDQFGQTVTFTSSPPSNPTVGGQYVGLAATGGASGNPVSFGSVTPDVCTVSGTTVSFDAAGTCTVQAIQAASQDYSLGLADQSFTISQVASQVTVSGPATTAPRVVGQSETVTATVTVAQGTVAGAVQFAVNGADVGTPVTVAPNGTATSPPLLGQAGVNAVTAVFTPSDQTTFADGSGSASFLLNTAASQTTLAVHAKNLVARVKAVFPGAEAPTGVVFFSVDGVQVGVAAVIDGVATLAYTTAPGQLGQVAAEYTGDAALNASSTSTATANPTITATITSAHAKSVYGWYSSGVTVTFTCTAPGAALTAACPDPVTLSQEGADQRVIRVIHAADGGVATVSVSVNIDDTPPAVGITGVPDHGFFTGVPPVAGCVASDALSGVATCTIDVKFHKSGYYTYTATARDKAGNVARVQEETAPAP